MCGQGVWSRCADSGVIKARSQGVWSNISTLRGIKASAILSGSDDVIVADFTMGSSTPSMSTQLPAGTRFTSILYLGGREIRNVHKPSRLSNQVVNLTFTEITLITNDQLVEWFEGS